MKDEMEVEELADALDGMPVKFRQLRAVMRRNGTAPERLPPTIKELDLKEVFACLDRKFGKKANALEGEDHAAEQ